jgi:hypothetical protein
MRTLAIAVLTALSACGQADIQTTTINAPQGSSNHIISRLPLIDACLLLAPGMRTVTIDPQSERSVRLSGESGSADCVMPNDTADPSTASILPALGDTAPDAILFVRAPGENPGGECYEAPEVRSASGELLGWMLDPQGC